MTVIFSKRCELGLQAVLYLSAQTDGKFLSAQEISEKLTQPKEFISKILQNLTTSGIVGSRKGTAGGFFLKANPRELRLIDIVRAIDGDEVFCKCVLGFPGCTVNKPCPVHNTWGKIREETFRMLSEQSLADLKEKTIAKMESM